MRADDGIRAWANERPRRPIQIDAAEEDPCAEAERQAGRRRLAGARGRARRRGGRGLAGRRRRPRSRGSGRGIAGGPGRQPGALGARPPPRLAAGGRSAGYRRGRQDRHRDRRRGCGARRGDGRSHARPPGTPSSRPRCPSPPPAPRRPRSSRARSRARPSRASPPTSFLVREGPTHRRRRSRLPGIPSGEPPGSSPRPSCSTRSARDDDAAEDFARLATPPLATALAESPPRLPADVKVPQARVLNVVLGESGRQAERGQRLAGSPAGRQRAPADPEAPGDGWLVTEVRG